MTTPPLAGDNTKDEESNQQMFLFTPRAIAYGNNKIDAWKAGHHAGLFAAPYGIPYMWTHGPVENDLHYGIQSIWRVS